VSHSIEVIINGLTVERTVGGKTIEFKVFEARKPTAVSCASHGPCWEGDEATIRFSVSGGQLFINDDVDVVPGSICGSSGSPPVIKTIDGVKHRSVHYEDVFVWSESSIKSLYLIAPSALTGVSVTATAQTKCMRGSSNSSCSYYCGERSSIAYATAYSVTISAMEKPWGSGVGSSSGSSGGGSSGWVSPTGGTRKADVDEDGKDIHRQWFHLWDINENALRANIAPNDLAGYVKESSFSGISVGGAVSVPDNNKEPLWKEVTSGIGTYLEVKATVKVGDNDALLTGTMTPADIVINDIASVEWEECERSRMVLNEQGMPMYLAELIQGDDGNNDYFTDIDGKYAVFPTFSPKPNEQALNQARVKIQLVIPVPDGMDASVHYCWFDPRDPVVPQGYNNPQFTPRPKTWQATSEDGNKRKDNKSDPLIHHFPYHTYTVRFCKSPFGDSVPAYTNTHTRKVIVGFERKSFGDNFIIAVHPNFMVADKYRFSSDGETLLRPGSNESVPETMRTSVLHVAAWEGFKVPLTWLYNEAKYEIATPEPTHAPNQSTSVHNNSNVSPVSVLDFDCNFRMRANFDYYGPAYIVPLNPNLAPHPKHPHRSFHRNSGVYIYDLIEMQIFDTAALLASVPLETVVLNPSGQHPVGIPEVNWKGSAHPSNGIKVTGDTAFESISGCVTGIPYLAESWHAKTQANLAGVAGRKSLDFTISMNTGKTIATIDTAEETFAGLTHGTGGRWNKLLADNTNWKIYLQSHWGSGVIFKNATLDKLS